MHTHSPTHLLLQLLLALSNPGDLREGVNDRRHAIVVNVRVAAQHALHCNDSLVFGLVRQHRTVDHIANRVNADSVRKEEEEEEEVEVEDDEDEYMLADF